jgi:zinc protease
MRRAIAVTLGLAGLILVAPLPAGATKIERVITPGGIEAWLVQDHALPLISLELGFRGGSAQDPEDKAGVSHMVASLLDEGAGDLDAKTFHERLEERAVQLSFYSTRDHVRGSLRTLTEHREQAFDFLRLALTAPRFDVEAVERVRAKLLARLRRETTSPNDIASRRWWETAFGKHPYGRPVQGTLESVPRIGPEDLRAYVRRVFARDTLKIAVVGDIDAATLAPLLDRAFAALPAKAELAPVAAATPQGLGQQVFVELNVPQAVVTFGGLGIPRKDPDFIPAYVVNHIVGGGSFSSRFYREVRENRGLAYGIHSSLVWLDHAALFIGGTATRSDRVGQTIEIIERELRRIAEQGPTEEELAKAKAYLKGSYPLAFDSSSKIAGQLVHIQLDELGIDYINRRNDLIDAVTIEDARRAARRLLGGKVLVTVVGRPQGEPAKGPGG